MGDKRKQTFGSSRERHRKDSKLSRFDKLEASLNKWTEVMDIRKEAAIAKMERYKKQANETTLSPYSIDACMELLDSMEDVSNVGKLGDGKDVTGEEGTANDSLVFLDALKPTNNFPHPQGDQFYLVDSGYPNMPGIEEIEFLKSSPEKT
ncbi:protein ALP1-like [Senna tora]|uniref:Protein ALP1-like n=1 Tax=Senna tora TaxID=362788 RepID=A0A834SER9_9FABA|nr:protein ALP1-like [Senna tora]